MPKLKEVTERPLDLDDLKLFRRRVREMKSKGLVATVEFPVDYPEGVYISISNIQSDGTFTGKLHDIWPCI